MPDIYDIYSDIQEDVLYPADEREAWGELLLCLLAKRLATWGL